LSLAWVQFVWNHRLIFHAPKPSFLQRNLIIAPLSSPKCILSSYTMGDPNWTLEQGGSSSWQYERRFSFWVEKIEFIVFRYAGFREHNIVHYLHQPRVSPFGFNRQIELGKARKGWLGKVEIFFWYLNLSCHILFYAYFLYCVAFSTKFTLVTYYVPIFIWIFNITGISNKKGSL